MRTSLATLRVFAMVAETGNIRLAAEQEFATFQNAVDLDCRYWDSYPRGFLFFQSQAEPMMEAKSDIFGAQPSTRRAFDALATSLAGSPARRASLRIRISLPVTRRAVSINSSTE